VRASPPSRHAQPGPFSLKGWLVVSGGAATAVIILVSWLPVSSLLSQRAQLSATAAHIEQLTVEGRAVAAANERLSSTVAKEQLARERYQLVLPGQRLLLVETPSFRPTSASSTGPYPGDPGYAPLAAPGSLSDTGGSIGTSTGASTGSTTSAGTAGTHPTAVAAPGFVSRVLATLQFWR
jgi:hypothetical protein